MNEFQQSSPKLNDVIRQNSKKFNSRTDYTTISQEEQIRLQQKEQERKYLSKNPISSK